MDLPAISPSDALIILVAWSLLWDIVIRPALNARAVVRLLGDPGVSEMLFDSIVVGMSEALQRPQKRAFIEHLLREFRSAGMGANIKPPSVKDMLTMGIAMRFGLVDPRVFGGGAPPAGPDAQGQLPAGEGAAARAAGGSRLAKLRGAFRGPGA